MKSRRTFLKSAGTVSALGLLAGCSQSGGGGSTTTSGDSGSGDGGDGSDSTPTPESTPEPFGNGEIDMSLSPSVAQEDLEAQYAPIRDYLSNEIGLPANMRLANNYSAVIEALDAGTSNVAETGPFAAALGVNADKAEIILQRKGFGSWEYVSGISVPADSDISSLSDLEGKKIAFSDRLSTSGALYPLYSMKTEGGLDIGDLPAGGGSGADFEATFAGGHPQAYETMVNGQADAAGHGGFVAGIADNFEGNARWLHRDEGLPRAPIVVSPQLSDENQQAVTEAFLEAPDEIYWGSDGEQDTDDDLWFNDVREANVDTYQSVIDVANELGVGTEIFQQ